MPYSQVVGSQRKVAPISLIRCPIKDRYCSFSDSKHLGFVVLLNHIGMVVIQVQQYGGNSIFYKLTYRFENDKA